MVDLHNPPNWFIFLGREDNMFGKKHPHLHMYIIRLLSSVCPVLRPAIPNRFFRGNHFSDEVSSFLIQASQRSVVVSGSRSALPIQEHCMQVTQVRFASITVSKARDATSQMKLVVNRRPFASLKQSTCHTFSMIWSRTMNFGPESVAWNQYWISQILMGRKELWIHNAKTYVTALSVVAKDQTLPLVAAQWQALMGTSTIEMVRPHQTQIFPRLEEVWAESRLAYDPLILNQTELYSIIIYTSYSLYIYDDLGMVCESNWHESLHTIHRFAFSQAPHWGVRILNRWLGGFEADAEKQTRPWGQTAQNNMCKHSVQIATWNTQTPCH